MTFKDLSFYLAKLEKTSSRLEITRILADLFKHSKLQEIDKICYLVLGTLVPSYKGIVLNLAEKMMFRVISLAYGVDIDKVRSEFKKLGDIGEVVLHFAGKRNSILEVGDVYQKLLDIAEDEGEKSQERKVEKMADLLKLLDPLSAKYVSRIPVGKLRLGFSDKTILDALSWMETGDKSKKDKLDNAYQVLPDVGLLAQKVKELGVDRATRDILPIVGVPVLPMLAQRLKSPTEMIAKMGKVFVEPKFDGLRVLIHYKKPAVVSAFTRNLNNVVDMFPELAGIGKFINAKNVILDTEAVGMDPEMIRLMNFQTTMKRRRKYEVDAKSKEIPLRFQVFDLISKDGENLMNTPYWKRREILQKTILPSKLLVIDEAKVTTDSNDIIKMHKEMVKKGLEGVMVKKYDAAYIPGRTGWRWVKMKQEEGAQGKLSDTIDGLVMGYTVGKGKRATFGLGQFLVGVVDGDEIKTLTKVGTGLTDEEFKTFAKKLQELKVAAKPKEYLVHANYAPDFWVEPKLVVELSGDDLTKSPIHTSGYALRFPRLVKFRDDKSVEEATTLSEVERLFKLQ